MERISNIVTANPASKRGIRNGIESPEGGIKVTNPPSKMSSICISTKDPFFNQDVAMTIGNGKVSFRHVPLSFTGKTHKPKHIGRVYTFIIATNAIPPGVYTFDYDESNEDRKIVYLEDVVKF